MNTFFTSRALAARIKCAPKTLRLACKMYGLESDALAIAESKTIQLWKPDREEELRRAARRYIHRVRHQDM